MKQDDSLLFFDFEDFQWEFVEDPALPLGKHVGKAVRKSVEPFPDFTSTITVRPRRDYPDSKLSFDITCRYFLDWGNHGITPSNWPPYSDRGQSVDADLAEAIEHAYKVAKEFYGANEFHLMP